MGDPLLPQTQAIENPVKPFVETIDEKPKTAVANLARPTAATKAASQGYECNTENIFDPTFHCGTGGSGASSDFDGTTMCQTLPFLLNSKRTS